MAAFLAACTPPTTGTIIIDVEELPSGEIVYRNTVLDQHWTWGDVERLRTTGETLYDDEYGSARADVDWEMLDQACVTDDLCIRIRPGARIEETQDGGDSWSVAWDLENRSPWVNASQSEVARVIEAFDVEVLNDGQVIVAMGELTVVRRPNGEWDPTIAELRTLPKQEMAPLLAAVLVTLAAALAWSAGRAPEGAPKRAGFAAALGAVAAIPFLRDLLAPSGLLMPVFLLASGLALVLALVSLATLLFGSSDRTTFHRIARPYLIAAASLCVAWAIAYMLWSRNIIPWRAAVIASLASTIAVFAFGWIQVAPERPARPASTGMRPYRNR